MDDHWFSIDFPMIFIDVPWFPVIFPWFPHGFPQRSPLQAPRGALDIRGCYARQQRSFDFTVRVRGGGEVPRNMLIGKMRNPINWEYPYVNIQ